MDDLLIKYPVAVILSKLGISFTLHNGKFKACCPFHSEKTPSFSVYESSGHFKCFGCGKQGTLLDLVKGLSGKTLYNFLGVKYTPQEAYPMYASKVINKVKEEKQVLKLPTFIQKGELTSIEKNQRALDYCRSVGFTKQFIKQFDISCFTTYEINGQKMTNRLYIPCYFDNKLYNIECRDYTKRSRIKVLYPPSAESEILFNWDNINRNETVFIVEGIKGLSTVWNFYSRNVISTFGKSPKPLQMEFIKTLPKICIIPDNDENKINKKTGLPVDNFNEMIALYKDFYGESFEVAYIPQKGFDTNDLTRSQLIEVLDSRKGVGEPEKVTKDSINDYQDTIKNF
jgi:hypothetical protein